MSQPRRQLAEYGPRTPDARDCRARNAAERLCGIPAVHPDYAPLQFENCDGRKEKARCIFRSDPCDDIGIGFAVTPNGTSACTRVSMAMSGTAAFHPIRDPMPGTRSTITFQIGHQPSSVPPVSDLLRL